MGSSQSTTTGTAAGNNSSGTPAAGQSERRRHDMNQSSSSTEASILSPEFSEFEQFAIDTLRNNPSDAAAASTSSLRLGTSIQGEIFRQSRSLQQIAALSYEDFKDQILELNRFSDKFLDTNGRKLMFFVKNGSDQAPLLWKATVRIICIKTDVESKSAEAHKALTLKEFLQVYNRLRNQSLALSPKDQTDSIEKLEAQAEARALPAIDPLDASGSEQAGSSASKQSREECCICFERKIDLTLPCTHSYCGPCIEMWNVNNKTCPLCREVSSTDDGWVISDGPEMGEIITAIQKSLMDIV